MRKGGHVMILDHSTLEKGYGPFKNTQQGVDQLAKVLAPLNAQEKITNLGLLGCEVDP